MVQTYQRQELPPGATGLVKPGYELADRSSQQRLAGMVVGTAADLWKQAIETQAGLEYTDFIGQVKTAEAEFEKFVTTNPNETIDTYTARQTKMLADIQKAGGTAKTAAARQSIRKFYNANEGLIREQTSTTAAAIVRRHQLEKFNTELQLAVNEGDTNRVNELFTSSSKSLFGDELAAMKYTDASNKVLYQKAQNDVSLDPQAFLDSVKDGTVKGYETLRPDQVHALTTYANAVKQFRVNQAEELTTQQIQTIHQLAIKNAAPDVVKAKIDQSDGLTPVQKTQAWKQYNEALSVRAKTGQNPYTETQNWPVWYKVKRDIAEKRITTPGQIFDAMNTPEGPAFGYVQLNDLLTDLPGTKSEALKGSFYSEWDRTIDSLYGAVGDQVVSKEKIPDYAKAKDQLKQIAETTGQDYTKAQAQLEALTTPAKEEKGRSWLSEWWQDMKESPILGEGAVYKRRRLAKEREQMFEGDLYGVLVQRYPDKEELILKAKANGWTAEAIAESLK